MAGTSTSAAISELIVTPDIRRLSVLTVSWKRSLPACRQVVLDAFDDVLTLRWAHLEGCGVAQKWLNRPSSVSPPGVVVQSSTMRMPCPNRSAPQYCTAFQIERGP